MSDSYLQEAFDLVCREAKRAEGHYVSLLAHVPRYGGPEEGGWWTTDVRVVAYQWFATEEAANAACVEVEKLAERLTSESRKEFGDQCLREMEWLDARGLDADYLPEPDGETVYAVVVTEGLPSESFGPTHYE